MFSADNTGRRRIDALGHISNTGKLFGGLDAGRQRKSSRVVVGLGIEVYPRDNVSINRAVTLDGRRFKNVDAPGGGTGK